MSVQFLSRDIRLPATAQELDSRLEFDHWMMTDAERSSLTALLHRLRPQCAIEIGTYRAGSLAVVSRYADKVYSLDIDPSCKTDFADQFANVEFITGRSQQTLPDTLQRIRESGQTLGFVLIDGNHSEYGVRSDINSLLDYKPDAPLYILMHDSFNPGCRRGMRTAEWSSNPHVHLVELDYVSGRLMPKDEGPSYRQMWCGFGLAVLLPEQRSKPLRIHENEAIGYQAAYWRSVHPYASARDMIKSPRMLARAIKRSLQGVGG